MPEQEFEIYLSLLSRLLRLNPAQKAAISDELRDHLEERLKTLTQSGSSRDDAIKVAMEEFGDITGLALDLTKASRTPLRKIAVRSTLAVTAFTVLIVGWLSFFVPEHRLASPPVVQADQPESANSTESLGHSTKSLEPVVVHDDELFPKFLTRLTSVNFAQTPLLKVCGQLEALHNVPVVIHRAAFAQNGIPLDLPVDLTLNELSFEEVLNHLTRKLGLAWHVDEELIQITTPEFEDSRLVTRQYDLSGLLGRGHTLKTILKILIIDTAKWQEIDGEGGTAASIGDALIVSQTYHDQRRIARILAVMESPPSSSAMLETCSGRDKLLAALRVPGNVDLTEFPLAKLIQILAERAEVPILFNEKAMNEEGVSLDAPVTLHRQNRPLGKLLDELLEDLQLTYQIRDGVIQVTTRSYADADMKVVAYNLGNLMASDELFSQLLKAIPLTTAGKWAVTDAEGGSLARTDVGGILFVKHTDKVQASVHILIEQLRQAWHGQAPDAGKLPPQTRTKMVMRSYQMSRDVATDLHQTLPRLVAPDTWGHLTGVDEPAIEFVTSNPTMESVEGMVTGGSNEIRVLNSDPAGSPKTTQGAPSTTRGVISIVVRPRSALVVRQTPEVHQKIQKFLSSLGVVFEVSTVHQPDGAEIGGGIVPGGMGGAIGDGVGGVGGGGLGGTGLF